MWVRMTMEYCIFSKHFTHVFFFNPDDNFIKQAYSVDRKTVDNLLKATQLFALGSHLLNCCAVFLIEKVE